jgi:hypothetical protein
MHPAARVTSDTRAKEAQETREMIEKRDDREER